MEKKSNGWQVVLIVAAVIAVLVAVVAVLARTERRMQRLFAVLEGCLTPKQKNAAFRVEL